MHILQSQFSVSKTMAVQVIDLQVKEDPKKNNMLSQIMTKKKRRNSSACLKDTIHIHTPINISLINIRMSLNCLETAGPPVVSSPTLLKDSSSSARVASNVGSQSDC